MTCPQLWQPSRSAVQRRLVDIIMQLRERSGFDFARIALELNLAGLVSPRGRSFYPSLVFSIYRKWTSRVIRERRGVTVTLNDVTVNDRLQSSTVDQREVT